MREMNLKTIYPEPRTTVPHKEDATYPYLLKEMVIIRPHQVWQVDITYLRTNHGFLYLTALIDVASRYVGGLSLRATTWIRKVA